MIVPSESMIEPSDSLFWPSERLIEPLGLGEHDKIPLKGLIGPLRVPSESLTDRNL